DYDLERVVRGALADAGVGRGEVTVHLHPEDHAALQGTTFRTGTHLAVDPNLARGDVHLSTPRGLLVRDVEGSLESIREQLLEELSE
ncbi:MAG: FliH/SctL family protein, partial [Planctomycetota bacterium]|nr:FliH/SctL family protein [Planctomycetota bacterium]